MSNSYKPENMPCLIPYFVVVDAEKSLNFYQKAFGFKLESTANGADGKPDHIEMRMQDAVIMFCREGAFDSTNKAPITQGAHSSITLYIYCHDVDKLYHQAVAVGAIVKVEPNDGFWGDRFCTLIDYDGYEWSFATKSN